MPRVEIEESELAALRSERDGARTEVETLKDSNRELTTNIEQAEAAQKRAEDEKAEAGRKLQEATEATEKAQLKDKRLSALGAGFMAKLGDTSKARLAELAVESSDEQWDRELAEREEWAGVKRDTPADGSTTTTTAAAGSTASAAHGTEDEVASFLGRLGQNADNAQSTQSAGVSVRQLARMSASKRQPAGAGK